MTTIAGLFDSSQGAERAVEALRANGFAEGDFSVVSMDTALQDRLGGGPAIGKDVRNTGASRAAGTSPTFAALSGGAVLGKAPMGEGIDAEANDPEEPLADMGLSREEAHYYVQAIQHGGVLVVVQASSDNEERARSILREAGATPHTDT